MGTTFHPDAERLRLYDEQVRRMIADPDMPGDILAVGMALAWLYRERGPETLTTADITKAAHLPGRHELERRISEDAPRWQIDYPRASRCEAPMIRRPGLCGKHPTSLIYTSQNWEDGTRTYHAFCTRHRQHGEQLHRDLMARDKQLREERGNPPEPMPNRGGLLARHFPRVDWDIIYKWARPHWKPPTRMPDSYAAAAPSLRLIVGTDEPEQTAAAVQTTLTVLHGMPDRLSSGRGARRVAKPRTGPRPA